MLRKQGWERKGVYINREYISNLRFADDLVIIAKEDNDMLKKLNEAEKKKGLEISLEKAKIMSTEMVEVDIREYKER